MKENNKSSSSKQQEQREEEKQEQHQQQSNVRCGTICFHGKTCFASTWSAVSVNATLSSDTPLATSVAGIPAAESSAPAAITR